MGCTDNSLCMCFMFVCTTCTVYMYGRHLYSRLWINREIIDSLGHSQLKSANACFPTSVCVMRIWPRETGSASVPR